jgi:hypothetical protein
MTGPPVPSIPLFDFDELVIDKFSLFGCFQMIERVLCFGSVWREWNSSSLQESRDLLVALISPQFRADWNGLPVHRR